MKRISDRCSWTADNIDLHMHTTFSDGSYTPEEVISWKAAEGISVMSITDHDNAEGTAEGETAALRLGVEFHPGIEFTAGFGKYGDTELHILGYDIDPGDSGIREACRVTAGMRRERNVRLMELIDMKYRVTPDDIGRKYIVGYLGKPQIAEAFVKKGIAESAEEATDMIIRSGLTGSVKKDRIPADEIIRIIKAAGGTAVLAHPGRIKNIGRRESEEFYRKTEAIVLQLKAWGLDGMEAVYRSHSHAEEMCFCEMAEKHGLIVTRGTDFHQ